MEFWATADRRKKEMAGATFLTAALAPGLPRMKTRVPGRRRAEMSEGLMELASTAAGGERRGGVSSTGATAPPGKAETSCLPPEGATIPDVV